MECCWIYWTSRCNWTNLKFRKFIAKIIQKEYWIQTYRFRKHNKWQIFGTFFVQKYPNVILLSRQGKIVSFNRTSIKQKNLKVKVSNLQEIYFFKSFTHICGWIEPSIIGKVASLVSTSFITTSLTCDRRPPNNCFWNNFIFLIFRIFHPKTDCFDSLF